MPTLFDTKQESNGGLQEVRASITNSSFTLRYECPYCDTIDSMTVPSAVVEIHNVVCGYCGSRYAITVGKEAHK